MTEKTIKKVIELRERQIQRRLIGYEVMIWAGWEGDKVNESEKNIIRDCEGTVLAIASTPERAKLIMDILNTYDEVSDALLTDKFGGYTKGVGS